MSIQNPFFCDRFSVDDYRTVAVLRLGFGRQQFHEFPHFEPILLNPDGSHWHPLQRYWIGSSGVYADRAFADMDFCTARWKFAERVYAEALTATKNRFPQVVDVQWEDFLPNWRRLRLPACFADAADFLLAEMDRLTVSRSIHVETGCSLCVDPGNPKYPEITDLAEATSHDHIVCDKDYDEKVRAIPPLKNEDRIRMMRRLIERGTNVNLFFYPESDALINATLNADPRTVSFLLEVGAGPNYNPWPEDNPDDISQALDFASSDAFLERGTPEGDAYAEIEKSLKQHGAVSLVQAPKQRHLHRAISYYAPHATPMLHFLKIFCFMACFEIVLKFGLMIGVFFPTGLLLLVLLTIHLGKNVL